MGDVVFNTGIVTRLDLPPERMLNAALREKLKQVVILGWTEDGDEYFASSIADGAEVLWLLQRYTYELMKSGDKAEVRERPDGCA
jgi:hypothetical protein